MTDSPSSHVIPLWINGSLITSSASPFPVTTPPSQTLTWSAIPASPPTITQAIESASAAFKSWHKTPISTRNAIFTKAASILKSKLPQIKHYMSREIAATDAWSEFNVTFCANALTSTAEILEATLQPEYITGHDGMQATVYKVPYGVVGAIAPWNAPMMLGLRSILAPIAAGNTVVMFSSPLSPMTHFALAEIFEDAGLPNGVLNILPSPPEPAKATEAVETLLKHRDVKYLNFTGSTAVGRKINEVAGRYGKPVTMELGGKCAVLALEDADLKSMSHELVLGAFLNSGQICMSTEHAIVPKSIKPELVKILKAEVTKIFPDPLPLVTTAAVEKVEKLLSDAVSKGATLEFGQVPPKGNDSSSALSPILVTGVTKDMDIYSTETFGPVFCLSDYEDGKVDDAVDIINGLDYGLSVAIFTKNEEKAQSIALDINSGAVHINHMTVYDNPSFPHGGVSGSGYGRFGGRWGIEEFTNLKTVTRPSKYI